MIRVRDLAGLAAPFGAAWVGARRDRYRRSSEPLDLVAHAALVPYFDAALLARVEVAHVRTIGAALPRRFWARGMLDLSTVRAMAFIDTIVVARANARAGDDATSLLFHELVHVVQFRVLGTAGFVRAYLGGWLDAGRSYRDNPLEVMAYSMQQRFDDERGSPFDVEPAICAALEIA